jgi:hypothetical protein
MGNDVRRHHAADALDLRACVRGATRSGATGAREPSMRPPRGLARRHHRPLRATSPPAGRGRGSHRRAPSPACRRRSATPRQDRGATAGRSRAAPAEGERHRVLSLVEPRPVDRLRRLIGEHLHLGHTSPDPAAGRDAVRRGPGSGRPRDAERRSAAARDDPRADHREHVAREDEFGKGRTSHSPEWYSRCSGEHDLGVHDRRAAGFEGRNQLLMLGLRIADRHAFVEQELA